MNGHQIENSTESTHRLWEPCSTRWTQHGQRRCNHRAPSHPDSVIGVVVFVVVAFVVVVVAVVAAVVPVIGRHRLMLVRQQDMLAWAVSTMQM